MVSVKGSVRNTELYCCSISNMNNNSMDCESVPTTRSMSPLIGEKAKAHSQSTENKAKSGFKSKEGDKPSYSDPVQKVLEQVSSRLPLSSSVVHQPAQSSSSLPSGMPSGYHNTLLTGTLYALCWKQLEMGVRIPPGGPPPVVQW